MLRQILSSDFMSGAIKTAVQYGTAFAQRRDRALDLLFTFADVGVDFLLVGKNRGDQISSIVCSVICPNPPPSELESTESRPEGRRAASFCGTRQE